MKDYEEMEHLSNINNAKIQVMEEMINTLQGRIRQLLEYDPLVYTAAGIYFLGVVNHYFLMNTIYIILEAYSLILKWISYFRCTSFCRLKKKM